MVCNFLHDNKPTIYCVLSFFGQTAGLVGLMFSFDSLTWSFGKPYFWKEVTQVVTIGTTILSMTLRDALDRFYKADRTPIDVGEQSC